jgi:hypothetical protein
MEQRRHEADDDPVGDRRAADARDVVERELADLGVELLRRLLDVLEREGDLAVDPRRAVARDEVDRRGGQVDCVERAESRLAEEVADEADRPEPRRRVALRRRVRVARREPRDLDRRRDRDEAVEQRAPSGRCGAREGRAARRRRRDRREQEGDGRANDQVPVRIGSRRTKISESADQ